MITKGRILLVVALVYAMSLHAQLVQCPSDAMLIKLLSFGDLYLGEIHGTAETPQLVQCLVEKALATSKERIIVSLELESGARDPGSYPWQETSPHDGRTSKAMFNLLAYLKDKESQGLLNLDFQHKIIFDRPDGKSRAEIIGLDLKALSERGLLIALSGNAHSMKTMPPGMPLNGLQEGRYVGPNMTHIWVQAVDGGTTWNCSPDCGVHEMKKLSRIDGNPDTLVDGSTVGHDYIYFIPQRTFTASPPQKVITDTQH